MMDRMIHIFSPDDFTTCPECGRRAEIGNGTDDQVDADQDGPIYEGECDEHGKFLWQCIDDTDEEDEDE